MRFPISSTIALQLLPAARATIMAARGLTVTLGGVLGTIFAGFVLSMAGFSGIGAGCAMLTGAGFIFYWQSIPAGAPAAGSGPAALRGGRQEGHPA